MYTQFRKAVETRGRVRSVFPTPDQLKPPPPGLDEGVIPTAEDLQQTGECPDVFVLGCSSYHGGS